MRKRRIKGDSGLLAQVPSMRTVIGGAGFEGRSGVGCVQFEMSVRYLCRQIEKEGRNTSHEFTGKAMLE